jgi:hypothetical protein
VLARRGQAGAQAGHGAPGWRLVQELGRYALVSADPPLLDDTAGMVVDPRRRQGMRVGDETAGRPSQ